jgi:hypothetical protein
LRVGVSLRCAPGRASRAVGHDTTVSDCAGPAPPQTAVAAPSRPFGRESLTQVPPRPHGVSHRAAQPSVTPAPPSLSLPLRFLQWRLSARCAGGWGDGLRDRLKVPSPVAPQTRVPAVGSGFSRSADLTGCARRNGFPQRPARGAPAAAAYTRAHTRPGGYARLGSLSPALASSLRRVGRLRRAFVGGRPPHPPTCSRGVGDRCGGAAPARSGRLACAGGARSAGPLRWREARA